MQKLTYWYAFSRSDADAIRLQLEQTLGLRFVGRESKYLGDYYDEESGRFIDCKIRSNRDPFWSPAEDPPEEEYFEPEASDCDYLLTITGPEGSFDSDHESILASFDDVRLIRGEVGTDEGPR